MRNLFEDIVKELMTKHNFPYSVIYSVSENHRKEYGDKSKLDNQDIINSWGGSTLEDCKKIFLSLEGQLLPQIVAQGNTRCLLFKPMNEVMIIMCCNTEKSVTEFYSKSQELNNELTEKLIMK